MSNLADYSESAEEGSEWNLGDFAQHGPRAFLCDCELDDLLSAFMCVLFSGWLASLIISVYNLIISSMT